MSQAQKPLVLNRISDLYANLGTSIEGLDHRSEFFICNLGDFTLPAPFISPIYRANFFSIIFVKDCFGTSFSDHYTFDIEPGTIYFNNPGDIKHVILKDVKELYLATLTETFLKENVHADIFQEFPFLLAEIVPPKILNEKQFSEFEHLYLQLMKEYGSGSPYRNKLIGHLIVLILLKIKEYFWKDYDPINEGTRGSQIVKNFKRLMESHYRNLSRGVVERAFRIQEYAEELNLHPNYLNAVIKTKTGKPVGTWISEKTITEAKSLLSNSDFSIKEIAFRLGFAESPHFCNYFKKRANVSPALYRRQINRQ